MLEKVGQATMLKMFPTRCTESTLHSVNTLKHIGEEQGTPSLMLEKVGQAAMLENVSHSLY